MDIQDQLDLLFAEARSEAAEMLATATAESDHPLFVEKDGRLYAGEEMLAIIMANVREMQLGLVMANMHNIAAYMGGLVIVLEAIHDSGHLSVEAPCQM